MNRNQSAHPSSNGNVTLPSAYPAAPGQIRSGHAPPAPFKRCLQVLRRPLLPTLALLVAGGLVLPPSAATAQTPAVAMSASAADVDAGAKDVVAAAIDINSASAEELAAQLKGVGASKAAAIVRYREQFGAFESIDELSEVSGIGAATVEQNRSRMRLR